MPEAQQGYGSLERFDRVDASGEAATLLAFLDRVESMAYVVARRHRSYVPLDLRPGAVVAEVGCGAGTAARELAGIVGPKGIVHGYDLSTSMIATARERAAASGLANVTFEVADAAALPAGPASIEAYRAERLYQHLARPEAALAEAARVLRPGGRIVILDQDWDTLLFDGDDLAASRDIARSFADSLVNGTGARRLRPLLGAAGFVDVEVRPETSIAVEGTAFRGMVDAVARAASAAGLSEERVSAWTEDQRRRIAEDRFLMSMTFFVTVGRRR